jgi:nucleoporin GLE1
MKFGFIDDSTESDEDEYNSSNDNDTNQHVGSLLQNTPEFKPKLSRLSSRKLHHDPGNQKHTLEMQAKRENNLKEHQKKLEQFQARNNERKMKYQKFSNLESQVTNRFESFTKDLRYLCERIVVDVDRQEKLQQEIQTKKLEKERQEKAELAKKAREKAEREALLKQKELESQAAAQAEEQRKIELAEETKQKELAKLEEIERERATISEKGKVSTLVNEFICVQGEQERQFYLKKIQDIKAFKKGFKFTDDLLLLKMRINRTAGQLTHDKNSLIKLIKQFHQIFDHSQKELLYYITAKKIVKQSELEVSARLESAFPLALMCVYLINKFEGFKDFLLARIYYKNPYLIPRVNTNEFPGIKKNETEIQYMERMVGISSLYFGILQTDLIENKVGMEYAWKWVARFCNIPPSPITAMLLRNFFEVAGRGFLTKFGSQGEKIIHYVKDLVIPNCPPNGKASTTRLEIFLDETFGKDRSIPYCKGRDFK